MSGEQQLERSVLEGKEREELHAIAEAIGLKPTSRVAKATLVGQILRATGVDEAANGAAPEAPVGPADAGAGAVEPPPGPEAAVAHAPAGQPEAPSPAPSPAERSSSSTAGPDEPSFVATPAPVAEAKQASPAPQGHQPRSSPPQSQSRPWDNGGGDGGPGSRRNRRRRGRDRDRPSGPAGGGGWGGERDLQAAAPDQPFSGEPVPVSGLLDLNDQGYGFVRASGYLASPRDVYVSISQVRRFALRKGDHIDGSCRPAGSSEKYAALLRVDTVSGMTPDEARARPRFEDLTPLFPDQKLRLEIPGDTANMVARIVDLISPIGKGQRGLIVSPPKAGKTTVLKQIAHSIEANNPEVHLMVLLVDERPEEVTDMRRSVRGEVVASTFDRPSDEHTAVAELAIERARRLVEMGKDVVIVLDGITRLARAYNLAQPATGRIMSGGVDSGALYPPKKFFGSARNIEEGGSLTILATALVETGSRMDEVIFEEFKGTGNMELRLDRRLAEKRVYPAIDVNASSTRHEELLFERAQLQQVWKLRRVLNALGSEGSGAAGLELLMDKIKTTKSNDEFLAEIAKNPSV